MAETHDKLLYIAIGLIAQKGFDAVSVREMTREAGIRESSFYNHFVSKKDLLEDIFQLLEQNLTRDLPDMKEIQKMTQELTLRDFLVQRMRKFLEGWEQPVSKNLWFVLSQQQYKNQRAARIILSVTEGIIRMYADAFRLLQEEGKMKECDPVSAARLYGYSVRALHLEYSLRQFSETSPGGFYHQLFENLDFLSRNMLYRC